MSKKLLLGVAIGAMAQRGWIRHNFKIKKLGRDIKQSWNDRNTTPKFSNNVQDIKE